MACPLSHRQLQREFREEVDNLLKRARSGERVDLAIGIVRDNGNGQRIARVTLAAR